MHPAWAARSDLPRPLGPQAPPTSPPLPSLGHLGPQLGALTLESPPPPPPPTPHLPPTHPQVSSPPAPQQPLGGPEASAPTPRLRSQPPVLPTPSSRQPGSQRSARPRSPCVLRGRRRGEAASAAGEVGAEAHTEARRLGERRRGGRDGARTAVDRGRARPAERSGQQAPGTERAGTGDPWPSMHRAPSPTAEQPPGRGDNTRRTPQPRLKLVSKRRCRGVEMGGAGLGNGVRRVEVEKRT